MSTRYTIKLRCHTRHTCPGCGCEYRVAAVRTTGGVGRTPEEAAAAEARRFAHDLQESPDPVPCPHCGRFPANVVGPAQSRRHGYVTAAGVLAIVLLIALAPAAGWGGPPFGGLAAGAALLTAAAHAVARFADPNRSASRNRAVALRRMEDGELDVLDPGDLDRQSADGLPTGWYWLGITATAAAAVVALTPAVEGRPAGELAAGAGQAVRVEFSDPIECVRDYWWARPRVTVRNATAFPDGVPTVRAESRPPAAWDVDRNNLRSAPRTSPTLWADLTVPDAGPAGGVLDMHVDLDVTYLGLDGRGAVAEKTMTAARDVRLRVVSGTPTDRAQLLSLGTVGVFAAGLMVLFAGLFLRSLGIGLADAADPPAIEVDEVAVAPAGGDDRPVGSR